MLYKDIKDFVKKAHYGQRYGNVPYLWHLVQVSEKVYELFGADKFSKKAALLHDVIEDTEFTEKDLLGEGIHSKVVEAVSLVTKKEGVGYKDYLRTLSQHELAWKVKVADTYCNLTESIKSGESKRVRKYSNQLELLYKFKSWEE